MINTLQTSWGPGKTPTAIKHLLIWIGSISLLAAASQIIFNQFRLFPGPENWLSLSWWGMEQGYLWQPITYMFFQKASPAGITFFYLIELFFTLYILWTVGSSLIEVVGTPAFLRFYFTCGILAGLAALFLMRLTSQYTTIATPMAVVLACITAWSMAFPDGEMLLFFTIPMQTRWAVSGLMGAMLLVSLAQGDMTHFTLILFAVLCAYLYATMAWKWTSPFSYTRSLDTSLASLGNKIQSVSNKWAVRLWPRGKREKKEGSKIVDIHTGRPVDLSDDAFMDAMLVKISRQGEDALTSAERARMQKISKRKMRN